MNDGINNSLFIQELSKKEYVWNPKLKKHAMKKQEQIKELGEQLGISETAVRKKCKAIRDYYVKEIKKYESSKRSGAETSLVAKRKWEYFDALDFMRCTVELGATTRSEKISPIAESCPQSAEITVNEEKNVESKIDREGQEDLVSAEKLSIVQPPVSPLMKRRKRPTTWTGSAVSVESVGESFGELQERQATRSGIDSFDHFGLDVAAQIRAMRSPAQQSYARLKVQELLHRISFPSYVESQSSFSPIPPQVDS